MFKDDSNWSMDRSTLILFSLVHISQWRIWIDLHVQRYTDNVKWLANQFYPVQLNLLSASGKHQPDKQNPINRLS